MKVILLAGGFGSRLRPLTNEVPKCLVQVRGRPLLDIWLEKLTRDGQGPFLINTHHLANKVLDYIRSSPYRKEITVVHEQELLGTAGTMIKNFDFFEGEDGMVLHADNYCEASLRDLIATHDNRVRGCCLTMMVFRTDSPKQCGIVSINRDGVAVRFEEKPERPDGDLANAAIYIVSDRLREHVDFSKPDLTDISTQVIPTLLGKIQTYQTDEILVDIGTIEALERLNILLKHSFMNEPF